MKKLSCISFLILLIAGGSILIQNNFSKWGEAKEVQVMNKESGDSPPLAAKNISITIVYDNNPYKEGILTSWGFSCLIRGTQKTILFDT